MAQLDRLEQRLSAVERVVVDDEVAITELTKLTSIAGDVSSLQTRLEEQERRIAELEATVQSIEGYVGNVESINDDVERQSAAAVATVNRLESRLDAIEIELDDRRGGVLTTPTGAKKAESEEGTDASDRDAADAAADESVAGETDDCVFEFGSVDDGQVEPEQAISALVDGDSPPRTVVDDRLDRPGSTANQAAVESALGGDIATTADPTAENETSGGGLLGSLKSRLS